MKKTIEHNGKIFFLELTFNTSVEKRIGGKRTHILSSYEKAAQGPWGRSWPIDNDFMQDQIEAAEVEIKAYADGKKITPEEEIATALGYK